ncbi:hypothetical protein VULLAG_LOCUS8353 [Vulpes lagopus]
MSTEANEPPAAGICVGVGGVRMHSPPPPAPGLKPISWRQGAQEAPGEGVGFWSPSPSSPLALASKSCAEVLPLLRSPEGQDESPPHHPRAWPLCGSSPSWPGLSWESSISLFRGSSSQDLLLAARLPAGTSSSCLWAGTCTTNPPVLRTTPPASVALQFAEDEETRPPLPGLCVKAADSERALERR